MAASFRLQSRKLVFLTPHHEISGEHCVLLVARFGNVSRVLVQVQSGFTTKHPFNLSCKIQSACQIKCVSGDLLPGNLSTAIFEVRGYTVTKVII